MSQWCLTSYKLIKELKSVFNILIRKSSPCLDFFFELWAAEPILLAKKSVFKWKYKHVLDYIPQQKLG